jgi:hypothetical protein
MRMRHLASIHHGFITLGHPACAMLSVTASGGYEEVTVTDLIKIWVLPGGLGGPRVDSSGVDF